MLSERDEMLIDEGCAADLETSGLIFGTKLRATGDDLGLLNYHREGYEAAQRARRESASKAADMLITALDMERDLTLDGDSRAYVRGVLDALGA